MSVTEENTETNFVRKEREHLDVLQRRLESLRLEWLRQDRPNRRDDPDYIPGEATALSWALDVLNGHIEPIDLRVGRMERTIRVMLARLGNVESELADPEDEL